ncbi:hypothetical protein ES288_A04G050100v1 [Gossypium darwinii]|uniref:Uncharacterized protein n=1 Tax=Gossypium darwinii TaxID=34276 RepID=A0A5D2GVW2_GOSDA|nr:hypothetical protein ES288_A04G050100v1 [Gossypium darwinii]
MSGGRPCHGGAKKAVRGSCGANCFKKPLGLLEFWVIGLGHLGRLRSWGTIIWSIWGFGLLYFWF